MTPFARFWLVFALIVLALLVLSGGPFSGIGLLGSIAGGILGIIGSIIGTVFGLFCGAIGLIIGSIAMLPFLLVGAVFLSPLLLLVGLIILIGRGASRA